MIGFETIGNATLNVFDEEPILTTDPWVYGNPYFGSWGHKYKIPKEQEENIKKSKFIFLSHGHPDHIDPDSFDIFNNKTLLIGDHYGDRIYNDLKNKYNCRKVKNNVWIELSENIRIKIFADWNQDSTILIEILKENIIVNLNDGKALGWSKEIKKILKNYKNKFLLKIVNWGDADMINFYNNDHFILPIASNKRACGPDYDFWMKKWNCNYAIPFSTFHKYIRNDSKKMNEFVTPLSYHSKEFKGKNGILLPAFIKWDFKKNDYQEICPEENIFETKDSSFFGDNWSDLLTEDDKKNLSNYFLKFEYLKKKFGFINFRIGKKDFNLKLSDRKEGIKIETPRNSLMMSVRYNIFDDILIGNFAKFELINVPDLYPDFTPYVAKYGDNGNSRTLAELKSYFEYYKLNSTSYWQDMLKLKTEDIIRSKIKKHRKIFSFLRSLRNQF